MLEKYLQEIGSEELLTPEEENRLAQQVKEGNEKALDRLVSANLRFVVSIATQYQGKGLPMEDLINEGNIALIKAARSFDPSKGTRLVVFAAGRIRNAIEKAIGREDENGKMKELQENSNHPSATSGSETSVTDNILPSDWRAADGSTNTTHFAILDEREREVIDAVYGISQPVLTLAEVGMKMGISRERARQIRDKALRKLRKQHKKQ